MDKIINWMSRMRLAYKEFITEMTSNSVYHIVDIYEDGESGHTLAEIKLKGKHTLVKKVSDVVMDLPFLEGFDKKTIRALTYLAAIESFKPDYAIVVQRLGNDVDDYVLEIRSRNGRDISRKTPSELSKDKQVLAKFSPVDANRIGYLAGVNDTVKEFNMKPRSSI